MRGLDDPNHRSHLRLTPAEAREAARAGAIEQRDRVFPAPADAALDELAEMALRALRYDGRRLAAALGLSQRAGEALVADPSGLTLTQHALLAQFLEFSLPQSAVSRGHAIEIATRLRHASNRTLASAYPPAARPDANTGEPRRGTASSHVHPESP